MERFNVYAYVVSTLARGTLSRPFNAYIYPIHTGEPEQLRYEHPICESVGIRHFVVGFGIDCDHSLLIIFASKLEPVEGHILFRHPIAGVSQAGKQKKRIP